jgi:HNH endonuclease
MPTKPLERLMFAQGGLCFFCKKPLSNADASVEHLVASANGGSNRDDNCVACCKALNALLGSMSLKEKVQVVLNQKGQFKCPNGTARSVSVRVGVQSPKPVTAAKPTAERYSHVVANLRQRGDAKPRTVAKLTSTINALYQNKLPKDELSSLLHQLQEEGVITISGTKITYVS